MKPSSVKKQHQALLNQLNLKHKSIQHHIHNKKKEQKYIMQLLLASTKTKPSTWLLNEFVKTKRKIYNWYRKRLLNSMKKKKIQKKITAGIL